MRKVLCLALVLLPLYGCNKSAMAPTPTFERLFKDAPAYAKPHGLILLVKGEDSRNLAFCKAALSVLPLGTSVPNGQPTVPTFWMDARAEAKAGPSARSSEDCEDLVRSYDYETAKIRLLELGAACPGPRCVRPAAGPVLVAYSGATASVYALDLSGLDAAAERRVMQVWAEQIVRDPKYWSANAYTVENVRAAYRNFAELVGHIILTLKA